MIHADTEKTGVINISGAVDIILTEYTVLTRLVMHQLKRDFGEDKAFEIVGKIGQVAARDIDQISGDIAKIQDNIIDVLEEVFKNEIQI